MKCEKMSFIKIYCYFMYDKGFKLLKVKNKNDFRRGVFFKNVLRIVVIL